MNKIPSLHYYKDKNDLINSYYFALIPVLLFSFYKNGILLYTNDLITFKSIFLPVYFYLVSILVGFLISLILKESPKYNILISLIISATISINTNIYIYPILLFICLFITKNLKNKLKLSINYLSLIHIALLLALLINSYSYLNIGEKLNSFNYNLFDIFLGHSSGGIATTSFCALIISFIILAINKYYKKIIPIASSLTFIVINIIYFLISKDSNILNNTLNGTIYFSFVFIAPFLYYTPTNNKASIIYGFLIGGLTSIIMQLFNIYEASYIAIIISSLFIPFIEYNTNKKYLHN